MKRRGAGGGGGAGGERRAGGAGARAGLAMCVRACVRMASPGGVDMRGVCRVPLI